LQDDIDLETESAGNEVDSDEDVEVEEIEDMQVVETGEEAGQLAVSDEPSGSMPHAVSARPDTLLEYDIDDPMVVTAEEMGEEEYAFEQAVVSGLRR
jgi:hypothetical protein